MSCHFYHKHNSLMPLPSTVAKQQCVCTSLLDCAHVSSAFICALSQWTLKGLRATNVC